jgi:hypothetical protein
VGGLNGYRYTLNPTGWVDPLGLACQCPGDIDADGPFSEIVPGGGLAAHEARGGHLMRKHIGRSEAQLRERLASEPHVPTASTFPDRTTAESAASSVLKTKKKEIEFFLSDKLEKSLLLQQSFPSPVGVGVIRKSGKLESLSVVTLVLRKSNKSPIGYNLHTGFVEKNEK